jgi:hypothetical protein
MNFLTKKIARLGKSSENFCVTFQPIELKVNVFDPDTQFVLIFKRGPKRETTRKYTAAPPKYGG